ncbi:hypothetical protein SLS58_001882 [Diplodia intermedia]|uniref:Nephrocystin 3-like N-terminal domain-containing protein n=1 Tax=Diplodia intermedia TaxID=856260 RepID=A0ABR3U048_9PEZI
MADPLSIAGTIAGLCSIADLVFSRVYRYAKSVQNAKSEIGLLAKEIRTLSGTLHSLALLAAELDDGAPEMDFRLHHINSCRQILLDIQRKVDKKDAIVSGESSASAVRLRLQWPFSSSETKKMVKEITQHQQVLCTALSTDSLTKLLKTLSVQEGIHDGVEEIKMQLRRRWTLETRIAMDKKRQAVFGFFGSVDPSPNHNTNRKLRHPLTGLWFTEGEAFKRWLRIPASKLWLSGIPGAGKSVLAAAAIESSLQQSSPKRAVAYFYCDYRDKERQEAVKIMGTIASQLARQDISERGYGFLENYFNECHPLDKPTISPDPSKLFALIKDISASFEEVSILVDALDECGDDTVEVVEFLFELNSEAQSNIRTLFLSRDEQPIRAILEHDFRNVAIAAHNHDVSLYVAAEIEKRISKRRLRIRSPEIKNEILTGLIEGARGM